MFITRFLITLVLLVSITLAVLVGALSLAPSAVAQTKGPWSEYTIIRNERSSSNSGALLQQRWLESQRSDGSRVLADVTQPHNSRTNSVRKLVLRPEGKSVLVDDLLRGTTTQYFKPTSKTTSSPTCSLSNHVASVAAQLLGKPWLFGLETIEIRTINGPYTRTTWEVPALDCAILRVREEQKDGQQQVVASFESSTESVQTGTPDPQLFVIPQAYREMSPLEMRLENARRNGVALPDGVRRNAERMTAEYNENHRAMLPR